MFKMCSTCKTEKLIKEFRRDSTQKDGYQCRCKVCARAATKSKYMINYGVKTRQRNALRNKEQRDRITEYKKTHPCEKCGESAIVCLDFHHVDPLTKSFELSKPGTHSWETILEEIEKCIVVCKNCHAKIHAGV